MPRARKPLGVADANASSAPAPHGDKKIRIPYFNTKDRDPCSLTREELIRDFIKRILPPEDEYFCNPKKKYRDWPVQEELEYVSTELERGGCKTPMWEIINVSEKQYKKFMSCQTLGFEVGSKNVVCRKGWDFFRQLEKEMKEEEPLIFDSEEEYLRWMRIHRPAAEKENNPATAQNEKQTAASTKMPIRAKKEKVSKTPAAITTGTKTKSAKGSNDPVSSITKGAKRTTAKECDMVDVSGIELPGEEDGTVEVYDTCDSLREKISDYLEQDGITQAGFLREISKCLPGGKKLSSAQLKTFMAKDGPKAGNTTGIFYAGYCYFEKLRIANGEEKSEFREEMEDIWDGSTDMSGRPGFDIWASTSQRYIGSKTASLGLDEYGTVHVF